MTETTDDLIGRYVGSKKKKMEKRTGERSEQRSMGEDKTKNEVFHQESQLLNLAQARTRTI